jgi:hypothetical protein
MARCDRGYLCAVCRKEVEQIEDSELYLRYVLNEVKWEELDRYPERHLACNPALSQFIVTSGYVTPEVAGAFSKKQLDPDFVRLEEVRVTRGYERLRELSGSHRPIWEYPIENGDTVPADAQHGDTG